MRRGGRLFIILGVGLALVAALLVVFSLTKNDNKKQPVVQVTPDSSVSVLQAAHDIPANTVIREDDVKVVKVERTAAANGAATNASQVVGLATNGDIVSGQQILMGNLVTPGLTNLLTNGKRAVALPVDRLSALGGLIRSDDYIDIVYSARLNLAEVLPTSPVSTQFGPTQYSVDQKSLELPPNGQPVTGTYPIPGQPGSVFTISDDQNGNPVTKVIMQNIRVLRVIAGNEAVNESAFATPTPTPAPSGTATADNNEANSNAPTPLPATDMLVLEVDPQQSELIKFLEDNQGKYQVVLRAPNDHATPTTTGMTYDQLMSQYGLPAPKPVEIPSGGQ
ncbi:MAG TPA: Flp pilus assembly protein CpaB [Nitrolancea sp.]|nr:Flp pilus assembly protein CpaB [Nitrolancea sp.]